MTFHSLRAAMLSAGFVVVAGTASATTVSFDDLTQDLVDEPYVENGVTVRATVPGAALGGGGGSVHLDDAYAYTSGVICTASSVFDVLRFSFTSLGFSFYDEAPTVTGNIIIRGFLNGTQIVRDHITMSPIYGTVQNIVLDEAFTGLDAFSIEILYPVTEASCDAPCGHINLDEVVFSDIPVAPVPLPASGLLLGAGALGLAAFARRRKG